MPERQIRRVRYEGDGFDENREGRGDWVSVVQASCPCVVSFSILR